MINQNARRTGSAGVMARAFGTLGAATLLLTSTGWGALAGNTGFGAVNAKAYQGGAAPVPAPKGGNNAQSPVSGPPVSNNNPTQEYVGYGIPNHPGTIWIEKPPGYRPPPAVPGYSDPNQPPPNWQQFPQWGFKP